MRSRKAEEVVGAVVVVVEEVGAGEHARAVVAEEEEEGHAPLVAAEAVAELVDQPRRPADQQRQQVGRMSEVRRPSAPVLALAMPGQRREPLALDVRMSVRERDQTREHVPPTQQPAALRLTLARQACARAGRIDLPPERAPT